MIDFFDKLSGVEQTFWGIALIASLVLVIIFLMTFLGSDVDSDLETDGFDDGGAGFEFFTFKNLVAFLPCLVGLEF